MADKQGRAQFGQGTQVVSYGQDGEAGVRSNRRSGMQLVFPVKSTNPGHTLRGVKGDAGKSNSILIRVVPVSVRREHTFSPLLLPTQTLESWGLHGGKSTWNRPNGRRRRLKGRKKCLKGRMNLISFNNHSCFFNRSRDSYCVCGGVSVGHLRN